MEPSPQEIDDLVKRVRRKQYLRNLSVMLYLVPVGVAVYFLLPLLLPLTRPDVPGGTGGAGGAGGWVIEPSAALRKAVAWYSPVLIVPFTVLPILKRRWARQDAAAGYTMKFPKTFDLAKPVRTIHMVFHAALAVVVIAVLVPVGAAIYLTNFVVVSDAGITDTIRLHRFVRGYDQVVEIQLVPNDKYWPQQRKHGPMVMVWYTNGRAMEAGVENGLTVEQTLALTKYIATRAGVEPIVPHDLR